MRKHLKAFALGAVLVIAPGLMAGCEAKSAEETVAVGLIKVDPRTNYAQLPGGIRKTCDGTRAVYFSHSGGLAVVPRAEECFGDR